MNLNPRATYGVYAVNDPKVPADFFRAHFGYADVFVTDWYVSLERHAFGRRHEIAFLRFDHPTYPAPFHRVARGVLINVEVDDVDDVWAELVAEGALTEDMIEFAPRVEDFGQKHGIFRLPDGFGPEEPEILVDLITEIPITGEYDD